MSELDETTSFRRDQGSRARKLFAAVALAALDDAIAEDRRNGKGAEVIIRWARSRDGREVLLNAGIEPSERCVENMAEFVRRKVSTSAALTRSEKLMDNGAIVMERAMIAERGQV